MKPFFIAATGTGIGKTFITAALSSQLIAKGKIVRALKPVISGFTEADSDTALLLKSQSLPISQRSIEAISPWRFVAPLSPDRAAALENKKLNLDEIINWCRAQKNSTFDHLLVEGVGGVMVPLNEKHTTLDWITALHYPLLLITGTYLGSISHCLSSLAALRERGIKPHAIIINESAGSEVSMEDTLASLTPHIISPIHCLKRATSLESLPDITSWLE